MRILVLFSIGLAAALSGCEKVRPWETAAQTYSCSAEQHDEVIRRADMMVEREKQADMQRHYYAHWYGTFTLQICTPPKESK